MKPSMSGTQVYGSSCADAGMKSILVGRLFLFRDEAAVAPNFPRCAVRLVEEVEQDSGMVLEFRRGVPPKIGVLLLGRAEPMKIQQHISAAVGDQRDGVFHQLA